MCFNSWNIPFDLSSHISGSVGRVKQIWVFNINVSLDGSLPKNKCRRAILEHVGTTRYDSRFHGLSYLRLLEGI